VRAPNHAGATEPSPPARARRFLSRAARAATAARSGRRARSIYDNDPTFNADPTRAARRSTRASPTPGADRSLQRDRHGAAVDAALPRRVGTFNVDNPLEIRGQGATSAHRRSAQAGFNVAVAARARTPRRTCTTARRRTLDDVFALHALGAHDPSTLVPQDLQDLKEFLGAIDGATLPVQSSTDDFLRTIRG
jgi:hypothetical protein